MTEIGRAALTRAGKPIPSEPKLDPSVKKLPFVNFVDETLIDGMKGRAGEEQKAKILRFFEHLASQKKFVYQRHFLTKHPLVAGAAFAGFKFKSLSVGTAMVEVPGERVVYEMLDVLEFNSTRKRMFVVDGPAMQKLNSITRDHMEKYADVACKLDPHWFQQWNVRFDDAQGNVAEIDRRKDEKPNAIDDLMEEKNRTRT
ncbi:hypothetical protein DD237_005766 [Peronospora effusa]|uniref:Uncharacterized protein n=2 Tax=Peronospora effusa TaxID=542832 RepID=A0A425CC64_9STRA|nr:hypothetical protein DD237_005766 [Peronospora effusa]